MTGEGAKIFSSKEKPADRPQGNGPLIQPLTLISMLPIAPEMSREKMQKKVMPQSLVGKGG